MGRQLRVFGSAPYLGMDQNVELTVRFGDRRRIRVEYDGQHDIKVDADFDKEQESQYNTITDILEELCRQYEDTAGEPPTKLLVMTWEKVLNEVLGRVLL